MSVPAETTAAAPMLSPATRRFAYLLIIAVAAGINFARIVTVSKYYAPARQAGKWPPTSPLLSANDRSRWDTVWSLVERGTYQIDDILEQPNWGTIDKVKLGNHIYSSKPPFLSTLVAGVYWVVRHTLGWDLLTQTDAVVHLILLIVNLLPMLAMLWVLSRLVDRYAQSDITRLSIVVCAAFGTLLTPFLITLNNHTPAAQALVFALYPAMRIWIDRSESRWHYAGVGFWSACVVCCELPAALFGLALLVLLFVRSRVRTLLCFVPAALLPIGFFLATNYIATGGLTPVYSKFGTEAYNFDYKGKQSYWVNPKGIDKGGDSPPVYLMHCTVGHHGILSLSPIFLLSVAGWTFVLRRSSLQVWLALALALTVAVLAFYLMQTKSYNYGGVSCGLRWGFWLIPLWLVSMIPTLDAWGEHPAIRWVTAALLAASVVSATLPSANPWQHPWLFNLLEQAGWIRY
ncbi:MAG TPA: hypothetical protein VHB77_00230 [Planctomycetaceae bacterium]|nr:hypothetical protein [Planctomycetaceae bacterium]